MDRKLVIETLAMILLIVAFPLISIGATNGITALWVLGFVVFVVGSILPVWTRFMNHAADVPRDVGMEFDDRVS
ncbi:hypothetical protein [Leifsonia sp. NPDC080035]|uniref:Uncharacterized protein n=1 Tax=Leifsonia sp. NPDC080035 TaxID=3143936 RepID=A0AAU7G960_9MICO